MVSSTHQPDFVSLQTYARCYLANRYELLSELTLRRRARARALLRVWKNIINTPKTTLLVAVMVYRDKLTK